MKSRIIQLMDLAEKKPSSVTLHLTTGDSSTINNNIGTGIINFSQTQQPQQNASDENASDENAGGENAGDENASDENASDENAGDERDSDKDETKFPSDLSIDHHPRRTSDYSLLIEGSSSQSEGSADNFRWMLDNTCISDLCFSVKSTTLQMVNNINPAQLSDIRLLAVNDIYLFDKNHASSISKYFSLGVHNPLEPSLLFETYHLENGNRCFDWCIGIEVSPPHNWLSSLTLCAKMLRMKMLVMKMLVVKMLVMKMLAKD
ncbi:hypothetical protein INT47_000028 [Mucor saturninus]|uniref:Uncharacterized protein n=1 Tax=Mucor saturninus TaxID=64648 RepID=A0A8H7RH29_9FUNG|nr:hypothetical protein INT47_000028 [Mucor saturninus]